MFIFELFFDTFDQRIEGAYMPVGVRRHSELAGEGLMEDEPARGVVFAAVATGVAPVFDLGMRKLVLLGLGAEAEGIDRVDDLAEVVAALDAVFQFTEDLADLVLEGVGPVALALKPLRYGKSWASTNSMRSGPERALL